MAETRRNSDQIPPRVGKGRFHTFEQVQEQAAKVENTQQEKTQNQAVEASEVKAQPDPDVIEQNHVFSQEGPTQGQVGQGFVKDGMFKEDQPIFPGGPLMSEVHSWQKQIADQGMGHRLFVTQVAPDFIVIWRTLSRTEYKEIVAVPNTDPLQREEMICEQCVLWPRDFNYAVMAQGLAGVPSLIAEQIMTASGFDRAIGYQPLFSM
jgi:hypothetical protein